MNDPAMSNHLSFPAIIVMHRSVLLYKCTAMNLSSATNDRDFLAKIAFWYCLERPFLCIVLVWSIKSIPSKHMYTMLQYEVHTCIKIIKL